MNLFLRPLEDVNDVTWSIVWCLVILLVGVSYYIVYILSMAFDELNDDDNDNIRMPNRIQNCCTRKYSRQFCSSYRNGTSTY